MHASMHASTVITTVCSLVGLFVSTLTDRRGDFWWSGIRIDDFLFQDAQSLFSILDQTSEDVICVTEVDNRWGRDFFSENIKQERKINDGRRQHWNRKKESKGAQLENDGREANFTKTRIYLINLVPIY